MTKGGRRARRRGGLGEEKEGGKEERGWNTECGWKEAYWELSVNRSKMLKRLDGGRTSEPSGKWTMEIVGEAAMARRGYIRGRSQRYRDPFVSSTREPRPSLSLFRSTRNIYPIEWHLDQIFPSPDTTLSPTTSRDNLPAINVIRYVTDRSSRRSWLPDKTQVSSSKWIRFRDSS